MYIYIYIITVRQMCFCVEVWCDPQRDIRRCLDQTRIRRLRIDQAKRAALIR